MERINLPILPPGLEDNTLEVFSIAKFKADAFYNGQRVHFLQLPDDILHFFEIDLIKNKKALEILSNIFDTRNEILEAYASCRYGNYDSVSDLQNGKLVPDLPCCGIECECDFYGIICKKPSGDDCHLSVSEIEVVKLIAQGLMDKEMAFKLNISINTVQTHTLRIRKKLDCQTRTEIAIWAIKHNL